MELYVTAFLILALFAILGSGVQAHSHLEAIRHVRDLTDVRVWSPTAANRERFAREASAATGLPVRACATPADAVRGAGVAVAASLCPGRKPARISPTRNSGWPTSMTKRWSIATWGSPAATTKRRAA